MRILDPNIEALFDLDPRCAIALVQIEWPTGLVLAHNGAGPQTWDGKTWWGTGELGSIGVIKEGNAAGQIQLTLRTTDSAQIAEVVKDDAPGSEVRIYLAALDANMRIAAAQLMYLGFVNKSPVQYNNPPTISVDCVGVEYRWNNAREHSRYTSAHQRSLHPTDSYCDDVEAIAKGPLSSYSASNSVAPGNRIPPHEFDVIGR
jgi:hypothetical protein